MTEIILAVETYGAQRVTDPASGQRISAYKIGYSSAAPLVLLALYGVKAQDVSPRKASYRYLQLDVEVVVRQGHILLTLTDDELAQVERISRDHHRAGVYRWRDQQWWELPTSHHADYSEARSHAGLDFDPTRFRPPSPSTGERATAIQGISAEKSQRNGDSRTWWWLTGDTYPHRHLLKRHGARFSGKRKAWFWIGEALPDTIQRLLTAQVEDEPCSLEKAAEILDLPRKPASTPMPVFAHQERVYARHDLENVSGIDIPTGTEGKIARRVGYSQWDGWRYDVDFTMLGVCRCFERELTAFKPVAGIRITHGEVTPAVLRTSDDVHPLSPSLIEAPAITDDVETATPQAAEATPPAIRIHKPAPMPASGEPLDAIQSAIQAVSVSHPLKDESDIRSTPAIASGRIAPIPQTYCGEVTGSVTGQVYCYGYAIHDGVCVYLNMAGPRVGVEAIRAKLSKGEIVTVVPDDAPAVELTAGEGNSGMYHAYLHALPEARFASLILMHDWAVTPNYGGAATTFIIRTSEQQAVAKLKHHVMQLVNIPVFAAWSAYLYAAGQNAMLVRKTRSQGGIDLLTVDLDATAWARLITGGIAENIITLPQHA